MSDMQDTPPRADVDEILRRKRKAREYKVRSHARLVTLGEEESKSVGILLLLPYGAMAPGLLKLIA